MLDLETLVTELSFQLSNGDTICHVGKPGSAPDDHLPDELFDEYALIPKFNGCYAVKNSTVCFIWDYTVYITPMSFVAIDVLDRVGMHRLDFDFPLTAEGEAYPKKDKYKWDSLVVRCRDIVVNRFELACLDYSHRHDIKDLDPGLINRRCLHVRGEGILYENINGIKNYAGPVVSAFNDPLLVCNFIGTYYVNNGKITFVSSDGKTYAGKAKYIEAALIEAGYKEKAQYVYFSNGETIVEERIRIEWEHKIS